MVDSGWLYAEEADGMNDVEEESSDRSER